MNDSILYLECSSGISGDMTVAALLDLGADRQALEAALKSLPLTGYAVEIRKVCKSGLKACDFHVKLDAAHENHDHDMEYLHGGGQPHEAGPVRVDGQGREGEPPQAGGHPHGGAEPGSPRPHGMAEENTHHHHHGVPEENARHHHHDARNLADITEIIEAGALTDRAKELALRIFRILAEAEALVHGKPISEVHFHEVGAVDSIVDIVSAAVCLDSLGIRRVAVSPLTEGTGQIRCQHGLIPVPVPAVTAIAAAHSLTLKPSRIEGELVTPTGAAIAAAIRTEPALPAEFRIVKTGLGAGKRDYAATGLLRAMVLEPVEDAPHDTVLTLETNIDDSTGEALSFTLQELMAQGALDAFCVPIYMKKNRPAWLIKVICRPESRREMESILFRNTTTIGIRVQEMQRTRLERNILAVQTPWGMADVKCCTYGDETYYYPENDSVAQLAKEQGIGFSELYGRIQAIARETGEKC